MTCFELLRWGLVGMALVGTLSGPASAAAQGVTPEETVRSVRRALERLPYYGVFDYIVFRVDRGTVHIAGYSFEGRLKADAEMAVKRVSGVDEVANKIEVLPASPNDDRIRWATFYRIYADDFRGMPLAAYTVSCKRSEMSGTFRECSQSAGTRSTSL